MGNNIAARPASTVVNVLLWFTRTGRVGLPVTFERCRNRNKKMTNMRLSDYGARASGTVRLSKPAGNP